MAKEYDPGKLLKSLGDDPPAKDDGLLSAFSFKPAPVNQAPPPPMPKPAAPAKAAYEDEQEKLKAKLREMERKLEEASARPAAAPSPPPAPQPPPVPHLPPSDTGMVCYLKEKVAELERKLLEAQEKGLAFAFEVKGREEARKESRLEMEEFLAQVKRQQAESETKYLKGLELEKARSRIDALEQKIVEASAPRPEPVPSAQVISEEIHKLKTGLREELLRQSSELNEKLLRQNSALNEELTASLRSKTERVESALRDEFISGLKGELAGLKAGLKQEISSGLKAELDTQFRGLSQAVEQSKAELEQGMRQALQAGGAAAADEKARGLAEASVPYNIGFVIACFDNLERVFAEAEERLVRASCSARQAAAMPGAEALSAFRRHAALLESIAKDMAAALKLFRGVKDEAVAPLRKIAGDTPK